MRKPALITTLAMLAIFGLAGCKKETVATPETAKPISAPFATNDLGCPVGPTVQAVYTTPKAFLSSAVAYRVGIDAVGNISFQGQFYGTADFQPGPGNYNLTTFTDGGTSALNYFNVLYSPTGNLISASLVLTVGSAYTYASSPNGDYLVYSAEPNPGGDNLNTSHIIALSKFNRNGKLLWKQYTGYTGIPIAYPTNVNSNIFNVGYDHEGNAYEATPDNMLQKFSSGGKFISKMFYGEGPVTIKTDDNNNLYLIGVYSGTIQKISPAGVQLWKIRFVPTVSNGPMVKALTVDALGNIYVTGYITETSDLDPGPGVYTAALSSENSKDFFMVKLDVAGKFVWAMKSKTLSNATDVLPQDIKVAPNGKDIFVVGGLGGRAMFNDQQNAITESYGLNTGAFILKVKQCL